MNPENERPENLEIIAHHPQRFKPSVLEVMIGSLIILGLMYLAYLVLFRDTGDSRGVETRIKALEARIDQRGVTLEKGIEGLKESSKQMEVRLKALEEYRKQMDPRIEGPAAKTPGAFQKPPAEDRKTAVPLAGKEKITHKVKKGETLNVIARKYRVNAQDITQWNRLPQGKTIKPDDKLIIYYKR